MVGLYNSVVIFSAIFTNLKKNETKYCNSNFQRFTVDRPTVISF